MSLETRASLAADRLLAVTTVDAEEGLNSLRRTHRRRRITRLTGVGLLAAAVLVVSGAVSVGNRDTAGPGPAERPPVTESTSTDPTTLPEHTTLTDPTTWRTFRSSRYHLTVGHPPDWTPFPATRDWSFETDARDFLGPGYDSFQVPSGDLSVSVWNAPLDPGTTVSDSLPALTAWVEQYCVATGIFPCSGISDRAVELCLEKRDCHPGLLVPFGETVQAFFSGGIYAADAVTVVAVWRAESHRTTKPYGGSQRLLENMLATMDVWPASTPVSERVNPLPRNSDSDSDSDSDD